MMRFAPGSLPWLLAHEIRLGWRVASGGGLWMKIIAYTLVGVLPVVMGSLAAYALRRAPDTPLPSNLSLLVMSHAMMTLLMVSLGAVQVLRSFRERADLDLLLSAPMSPMRVLAAKAMGVAFTVSLPFYVLLGPFFIASMVFGHPSWGGGLIVIGLSATIASSIAFMLTAMLVRLLGERRTRTVVHVGGALLGASAFLFSQGGSFRTEAARQAISARSFEWPAPLDWAGRALTFEIGPMLGLIGVTGVIAMIAARVGARPMMEADESMVRSAPARPMRRFRTGLLRVLVWKEMFLLARDPELLAQVLLRLVYFVPLLAVVARNADAAMANVQLAAGCVALAGMVASSLAWITVCAEDAPELIDTAPVPNGLVKRAKLLAACLPPMLVVALPLVWLALRAPLVAVATLACSIAAATSGALVQSWFGKVAPRARFRRRANGSFLMGISEVAMAMAWAGAAAGAARGSAWGVASMAVAVAMVAVAVLLRPRQTGRLTWDTAVPKVPRWRGGLQRAG